MAPNLEGGDTICRSLSLAVKRAKAMIKERDFEDYANAHTEDVSRMMAHSFMRVSLELSLHLYFYPLFRVHWILVVRFIL